MVIKVGVELVNFLKKYYQATIKNSSYTCKVKVINRTYQRIIALTLAFLILMTSVSFAIDSHYCNGELKSVSLFGKAKTCHEKAVANKKVTCPHHQKMQQEAKKTNGDKVVKNDCCKNKTTIIQSDDDQINSDLSLPISQQLQQFAIAYILAFHATITTDKQSIQEISYLSPVIPREIYVLSEAFLL
jgi:hypothetical protein